MKKFTSILIALIVSSFSISQINYSNSLTPQGLVENVLVGSGVTVSNFSYNNVVADAQVVQPNMTSFTATGFPFTSGVFMGTAQGGDVSGDPDLMTLASNPVTNGAILEFDFVPFGDTIKFRYIFGSIEYPGYTCSSFNDAFGFFISGPGIAGPFTNSSINIATVPGTNIPVSINTVNSGVSSTGSNALCLAADPNYLDNVIYFTNAYDALTNFNGGTVAMTAITGLQCGQTYHIKLAIANAVDTGLDSGVYLEGNSFTSDAVSVSVATVTGDSTVIEGCTTADFIFTRPASDTADTLIINYDIDGTATQGTDYASLANPVTFLPGQDSVVLSFNPFSDNIVEAPETVIITAYTINSCGDTIVSVGSLTILDAPIANLSASTVTGCSPLDITFQNLSSNATSYKWDLGSGFVNVADTSSQFETYTAPDTIYLIAINGVCDDTASISIFSGICGCMNPLATNYNPLAVTDDGSCIIPIPVIVAPNVFTPNSDADNNTFYINTTFAKSTELKIVNRWGNVVFEGTGTQPEWDGKNAEEGVYFYTYKVTGVLDDVYEGHGFVELVK